MVVGMVVMMGKGVRMEVVWKGVMEGVGKGVMEGVEGEVVEEVLRVGVEICECMLELGGFLGYDCRDVHALSNI